MTEPTPTQCRGGGLEPPTNVKTKTAAGVFTQLAGMLTDDGDADELCTKLAELLDTMNDDDLKQLMGGYTRLALVPEDDE